MFLQIQIGVLKMGKYFKLIGWLELISFVVGLIYMLVVLFSNPFAFTSLLLVIVFIIVGPALGLLFLSYGSRLEEEEEKEKTQSETRFNDYSPKASLSKTSQPVTIKQNKKDLIIAQLIVSDKFGSESIDRLRTLSEEELLVLLDEAYPNKEDVPISLKLDDITIKGEMINVKSSSYNMKFGDLRDITMTSKTLSFVLFNKLYVVMFNNILDASSLYNTLKQYSKDN